MLWPAGMIYGGRKGLCVPETRRSFLDGRRDRHSLAEPGNREQFQMLLLGAGDGEITSRLTHPTHTSHEGAETRRVHEGDAVQIHYHMRGLLFDHLPQHIAQRSHRVDVEIAGGLEDSIAVAVLYLDIYLLLCHLSLIHISEPTRRTPISYAVFC